MLIDRPVHRPVEFARRLDLTANGSRSWLSLVGVLAREAGRVDGLLRHRLAVANLQHLLVEGLLLTQPHNYTDALNGNDRPASHAVVKRAVDLMCGRPETAWTTAEVARAAGVSARALQKAFAQADELPPMKYLRQLRLHRERPRATFFLFCVTVAYPSTPFCHLIESSRPNRVLISVERPDAVRFTPVTRPQQT
jgi:AraC-binding-like domain